MSITLYLISIVSTIVFSIILVYLLNIQYKLDTEDIKGILICGFILSIIPYANFPITIVGAIMDFVLVIFVNSDKSQWINKLINKILKH